MNNLQLYCSTSKILSGVYRYFFVLLTFIYTGKTQGLIYKSDLFQIWLLQGQYRFLEIKETEHWLCICTGCSHTGKYNKKVLSENSRSDLSFFFSSSCSHVRLCTVVGGPAGQLCPQVSCGGCGAAGSLHHTAQSARLVTCKTGPPVSAGSPEQDGILLHHGTGSPGTETHIALNAFHILELGIYDSGCFLCSDPDAVLAACDRRPLSVVSTSCTLEYLVPSALLLPALPLLGDHLQHPHDL